MSKDSTRFATMFLALVLGLTVACFAGPVLSAQTAFDNVHRDYRIVPADPAAENDSSRRRYRAVSFSCWGYPSEWEGRKVDVYERVEKTREGDRISWKILLDAGDESLIQSERKVVSKSGKTVIQEMDYFGEVKEDFPKNTFHFNTFPLAVQSMNLAPGAQNDAYFAFSPEMAPWHIILVVEGEETVTVPAGAFDCIKVRVEFGDDGFSSKKGLTSYLMKMLLPNYYLWVDKQAPHTMIRFQGKFEGFTSPDMVQELVKVH